ncbi:hypothetical protein HDV05_001623 [Chytridiales sp. JEL 0842]|nr:hypothetical protein HDV05_001623 [Chytridiales sp. JEL 0842]
MTNQQPPQLQETPDDAPAFQWTINKVKEFYSRFADVYDKEVEKDDYIAPTLVPNWIIQELLKRNLEKRPLDVLDLGCGTGKSSIPFFRPEHEGLFKVVGVDATSEMLEKAKALPFADLRCSDILQPCDFFTAFDAVVCVGVMDFIQDRKSICTIVSNYLASKGLWGVTFAEEGGFSKEANDKLLEGEGFAIVHHERFFGYKDTSSGNTVYYHGFDTGWKPDLPMFQFNTVESLENFIVGSDADIGGLSEAYWGLTPQKTGLFWGRLSTEVPPTVKLQRSGYAGIRSRERPLTLFHHPRYDTSLFRYLAIRARSADRKQWFVNIQTDSFYPSYLWQHRLHFQKPGEWEVIMIPFRDFVLTSHGYVQKRQLAMDRSKVKTVGFSIVRQDGEFSLELDWIKAVNLPNTLGDRDLQVVQRVEPSERETGVWTMRKQEDGGMKGLGTTTGLRGGEGKK